MAAACLLTASRGAWMAVAVGLAVLVAYRYIARWQVAIAAVGRRRPAGRRRRHGGRRHPVVDPVGRRGRRVPIGSTSTDRRWRCCATCRSRAWAPATSSPPRSPRYVLLIQVPFITYAHNLTLQLWLAYGLFGLAAWYGLAAATAVAGGRRGAGRAWAAAFAGCGPGCWRSTSTG